MNKVQKYPLPEQSVLHQYEDSGAYTDCYAVDIEGLISQPAFITAFYTTHLFKLERFILSLVLCKPSTDQQADALANNKSTTFAAWTVETRTDQQLLLTDFKGHTRSWLMAVEDKDNNRTRLYFGSAVVPILDKRTGQAKMGFIFKSLLGFHKIYSKALLYSAVKKLVGQPHAAA